MEPVKWLTSALGATAAVQTAHAQITKPDAGAKTQSLDFSDWLAMMPGTNPGTVPAQQHFHARDTSAYGALSTRNGYCLDTPSGNFKNGQAPQIWGCTQGSANQQWKISGTQLRTSGGMCLDVPHGNAYYGAPLQEYTCSTSGKNRNQMWEAVNGAVRLVGTNWCLDIKDGNYNNGSPPQLWACDFNANGNQHWTFGAPKQTTTQSPSSFLGYATISWAKFASLHTECAPYGDAFVAAAAGTGLVPTLVAAIAETESSCNPTVNSWGLMQFSDDNAWKMYGGGGNRLNPTDAAWAGARYIRALLDQNNQNLDNALRAYNGPLSQGGNPNYQKEVRLWMSGGNPWDAGI